MANDKQIIPTTFQLKRGTAQALGTQNPMLEYGEPCFELDTNKLKIGDGTNSWSNLPYVGNVIDKFIITLTSEEDEQNENEIIWSIEDYSLEDCIAAYEAGKELECMYTREGIPIVLFPTTCINTEESKYLGFSNLLTLDETLLICAMGSIDDGQEVWKVTETVIGQQEEEQTEPQNNLFYYHIGKENNELVVLENYLSENNNFNAILQSAAPRFAYITYDFSLDDHGDIILPIQQLVSQNFDNSDTSKFIASGFFYYKTDNAWKQAVLTINNSYINDTEKSRCTFELINL